MHTDTDACTHVHTVVLAYYNGGKRQTYVKSHKSNYKNVAQCSVTI